MKIIIVGDGKVGMTLTEYLAREGYDIVVIDQNHKVVDHVVNTYDVMGICGNGANYNILMEAGAEHADLLIAATSSDEVNILSCLMAKKIGTQNTIARVRNPEHAQQLVFIREELGLSMVVNPELEAAREISRILRFPSAIKLDCFSKGRVDLAEIRLPENGHLAGQRLSDLYKICKEKILICAVQRGDQVIIPDGNFELAAGDRIHITGSHGALASFFKSVGIFKQKSKHVLIVGGGKIAYYLAQQLVDIGVDVKIIEQNENRCLELSEALPRATIICGDGTDQSTLLEEGLATSDACVVLTGIDEENIIVSLYAQTLGLSKVITKIDRISFVDMVESVGIESFVSPKFITANRIVRYVRAMQDSGESSVKTLYKIVNNQAEALEFSVHEKMQHLHIPLKDLKTKKGILFAAIIRHGRVIIPGGDDCLEPKDSVIVIAAADDCIKNLEDIFL
ncbi:MAG: Trk system potassium transporter TrkA [Ruminococcaceae bacterium]|nr:Trk system potassium transporter TrkA [Oscillospiraceae bacterium]